MEQIISMASTIRATCSRIVRSPNSFCGGGAQNRMMSFFSNLIETSSLPSRTYPWLMLPPTFEGGGGGDMVYNFYSLAEGRVRSFPKRGEQESAAAGVELPDDDAKFVGSSHGWLALFNQRNNDLFLSNPLTRQHVKLPPVDTLPDPHINLRHGHGSVSKLIITCSPFDEFQQSRALMAYGPGHRLASCCPGDTRWTPLNQGPFIICGTYTDYACTLEDFAYWHDDVFTCILNFELDSDDWDLAKDHESPIQLLDYNVRKPSSPTLRFLRLVQLRGNPMCSWWEENKELVDRCMQIPYLVYADKDEENINNNNNNNIDNGEQLYIVIRFVIAGARPDGTYDDSIFAKSWNQWYPYKTVGFSVLKICPGLQGRPMEGGSLDGLAMFIGINHSFALSAERFPELKANSIYFTDPHKLTPPDTDRNILYGGHDIGIFDYENKTFSSCYEYPCDARSLKRIVPPPMWFTPSSY